MIQRPIQIAGTMCPLWRKDVSKVCHTCEWYCLIKGKHPQTEEMIDQWGCSIRWMPMLQINTAQASHQGAKATESFRNEVVRMVTQPRQIKK